MKSPNSDDKICWCCLRTDVKLTYLLNDAVKDDYMRIVGTEACSWNMVAKWLCWTCHVQIKKASVFQICVKDSYSTLSKFFANSSYSKDDLERLKYDSRNIAIPNLSQNVLELWSTPDELDNHYDDFCMEDADIKTNIVNNYNLDVSFEEDAKEKCNNTDQYEDELFESEKQTAESDDLQSNKIKKRKGKKVKKREKSKKKRKTLGVVLKNRMVLETLQYKVIRLTPEQVIQERNKILNSDRYLNSPFKCSECAKGYNYEDVLLNHMSKHQQREDYLECKLCHQFLPSVISLRGHTKSHLVRYQCRECGEIRASRQHLLEHHSLQHGAGNSPPKQYTCNVCGKTMMKRTMFQKHVKLHAPSSRLPCEKCGKSFKTIETLRAHKLRHVEVKHYKCTECPKEFRYASLLYTHRVTHMTTKNYYCVECDLRFKTQSNLRLHLNKSQKHVDPNSLKFQCMECDKRYTTEMQLQHHIECIHMGKREFACPSCDRQYATKDGLRAHTRKEHPPPGVIVPPIVAKHICDICSRAFKAKAVLVKHLRTHTGERPFQCLECSRAFSQRSTLATHIKLVHKNKANKVIGKPIDKIFMDTLHLNL